MLQHRKNAVFIEGMKNALTLDTRVISERGDRNVSYSARSFCIQIIYHQRQLPSSHFALHVAWISVVLHTRPRLTPTSIHIIFGNSFQGQSMRPTNKRRQDALNFVSFRSFVYSSVIRARS